MPKGITIGPLTADGLAIFNLEGNFAHRLTIYLAGDIGGGSISFGAGTKGRRENIKLLSPVTGVWQSWSASPLGLYNFEVCCDELSINLIGSTTPSLLVTLIAEPRR